MNIKGLNILVDGCNLELLEGTGIKTYSVSLLTALKNLGAKTGVLLSKYSVKKDKTINTDALAMFQKEMVKPWLRLNFPMIANTVLQRVNKARNIPLPRDMVITRGMNRFAFINENDLHMSRGCYTLADNMRYLGLKAEIKTSPGTDIWHATYFTPITIKGAAKITTIHDIVPLRLPYTTTNDKSVFVEHVRDALQQSQVIIAVSETTKKDLLRFFDADPDKIVVTYQPIIFDPAPVPEKDIETRLRYYNLENKNYVLFVGAIEPKKNIRRLLNAWMSLDCDMPLAIVGKRAWLWEEELKILFTKAHTKKFKQKLKERIRLLEYVPMSDLSALYQGAKCMVFPSLYEGFGLPVLEAMATGCPVITSTEASLPEVCGNAALYVNPYDTMDIASKLDTLLRDEEMQNRLRTAGFERANFFSQEKYAERLQQAYAKV